MIKLEFVIGALEYAENRMKWLNNNQEAEKLIKEIKTATTKLFPEGSTNEYYLELIEHNRSRLSYLFLKHMGYYE